MVSHACEEAVTRALKVHASVTNRNKRRRVHFHTKDGDQELDEKDIQEQVEQLKLYRDQKDDNTDTDSSSSSDNSD